MTEHGAGHPVDASNTEERALTRLAVSATAHCLTGCAIGEVLGLVIGTALGWGTGATIALALILARSKEPSFRQIGRLSLPTQVFQINEPIFFGLPIVLNPVFMVPYVCNALILTTGTYLLMQWSIIHKPFVNVPWTMPPVVGHYLVSGGDWRAAVWGLVSIMIAALVYFPFAKAAERQRRHARKEPIA
jgi:PTS system cellobiose-specific IIC component